MKRLEYVFNDDTLKHYAMLLALEALVDSFCPGDFGIIVKCIEDCKKCWKEEHV